MPAAPFWKRSRLSLARRRLTPLVRQRTPASVVLRMKPSLRPGNPRFGSGPTTKRPGWSLGALDSTLLGRSHRAAPAKARLAEVIERSRALLGLPDGYRLGIVPG